jgi:hypothetical protein
VQTWLRRTSLPPKQAGARRKGGVLRADRSGKGIEALQLPDSLDKFSDIPNRVGLGRFAQAPKSLIVMLRITPAQHSLFAARAEEDFYWRAAKFFREEYGDDVGVINDKTLLERVKRAAARAARHGIETELGLVYYAALDLLHGPDFDTAPEFVALFQYPEGTGDEKIGTLFEKLGETPEN